MLSSIHTVSQESTPPTSSDILTVVDRLQ